MPALTTTIEDANPLIVYSPPSAWFQGNSTEDPLVSSYSASSFFGTNVNGASATFNFSGTSISIFGAQRDNHGPFTVILDGTSYAVNGFAPAPFVFQAALFTQASMEQGFHTIEVINSGATFLDIDFITWTSEIGTDTEKLTVNTVQDTDDSFYYSSNWANNVQNMGSFSGGTGHTTPVAESSVTYTFTAGDAVGMYGTAGPTNAAYSVTLDGVPKGQLNANRGFFLSQQLLYRADNLGSGTHKLVLTNTQTKPGQVLQIDYAETYSVPSVSSSGSGTSTGLIAGIVVLAVVIIGLLGFLGFLILRRRREFTTAMYIKDGSSQDSSTFPIAFPTSEQSTSFPVSFPIPEPTPAPAVAEKGVRQVTFNIEPITIPETSNDQPAYASPPTRPERRLSTFTDLSSVGSGAEDYRLPPPNAQLLAPLSPAGSSVFSGSSNSYIVVAPVNSTSPRPNNMVGKMRSVRLPPSAGQSLAAVPSAELLKSRAVVEGRTQDFGSLEVAPNGTDPSDPLPPDYHQATEPFRPAISSGGPVAF